MWAVILSRAKWFWDRLTRRATASSERRSVAAARDVIAESLSTGDVTLSGGVINIGSDPAALERLERKMDEVREAQRSLHEQQAAIIEALIGLPVLEEPARDVPREQGTTRERESLSLIVESAKVRGGEYVTVRVLALAPPPGIGAYLIDVYYDLTLINAVACESNPNGICNPTIQPQVARFVGASATGLTGTVEIGRATFHAAPGVTGKAILTPMPLTLADQDGQDLQSARIQYGVIEVV